MSFLSEDVPWGRAASAAIPVPPFGDVEQHLAYLRWLQLHVAMTEAGPPSIAAVALGEALQDTATGLRTGRVPHAELGRLAVRVSLATFFPAPWTPSGLAAVLAPLRHHSPHADRSGWSWDFDPVFTARPHRSGGWTIRRDERGQVDEELLTGTDDLVLLWMDHHRDRFPYPYGHARAAADLAALAPAARASRRAADLDRSRFYLTSWVAERDRALSSAAGPGDPGPV